MRVKAICCASFKGSVKRAVGVEPVTSPPVGMFDAEWQDPGYLACELLYVKLHGLPDQPYWYGDGLSTCCSAEQLERQQLAGAVVFAGNCNLPESPMLAALFAAGVEAVVCGSGVNYGGRRMVRASDILGQTFVRAMRFGLDPRAALRLARARVEMQLRYLEVRGDRASQVEQLRDTLEFRLWRPGLEVEGD